MKGTGFLRFLLFPIAIIYGIVVWLRNLLYDFNILKSYKSSIETWCIGNISAGGTGKTPHVIFFAKNEMRNGRNVAILSRGYGRKTKGLLQATPSSVASEIGDEPLEIYNALDNKCIVVVSEDRQKGLLFLEQKGDIDLVIMDDGLQHRAVLPHRKIVLTTYTNLFYTDYLLPIGHLRDWRYTARNADEIIVTKCPDNFDKGRIKKRLKYYVGDKVQFSKIVYSETLIGENDKFKIINISNQLVLLITSIANPRPILEYLKGENVKFLHHKFSDHYSFTPSDIRKLNEKKGVKVCTAKDYVKLRGRINDLYYLPIEVILFQ